MEQLAELLGKHVGQWISIYVIGPSANAVGGKVTKVVPQYVELEQEGNLSAYVPLDKIVYITAQKQGS